MDTENKRLFTLVEENMIFAHLRSSRKLQRGVRDGSLLTISRGAFLPADLFAGVDRFTMNRMIHLARALVATRRLKSAILGGPTALMAAGIDQLWETSLDVVVYSRGHIDYHQKEFPAVVFPDARVIPKGILHITCIDSPLSVVPVLKAAIQCVRLLPKEQGFVSFLMAAQYLAKCDRNDRDGSHARIEILRKVCQEVYEEIQPRSRGCERLRRAVQALVGPIDSVLEARMIWLLSQEGFEGYTTQFPIKNWGGHYYPDIAFPEERLLIELDGQVKYQGSDLERQIAIEQQNERQREIEQQGWRFLRFRWDDLRHKQKVAMMIQRALLG